MRSVQIPILEMRGLHRDHDKKLNSPFAVQAQNVRISDHGLNAYVPLTMPFSRGVHGFTHAWPLPQDFLGTSPLFQLS